MLIYQLPGTFETREGQLDLLWEAGATGLEERGAVIRAYFSEKAELPSPVADGEWREEEDQDWLAEFRRTLKPVQAGRITIVAPWQQDQVPPGGLFLSIEPGMAFGTGHHATTRMAVEALCDLPLQGQRVLDLGTGSGVLAMAAARLGAEALGLDIDPLTVPIARENAELNGLSGVRFAEGTLGLSGEPDEWGEPFDVLVANLYAELHDLLAEEYAANLVPGGPLVLTGILVGKLELVRAALDRAGFVGVEDRRDGDWALVTARRAG